MKIILNKGYGGFDVSYLAHKKYAEKIGIKEIFAYRFSNREYVRSQNPDKDFFTIYMIKDLGDSFHIGDLDKYNSFRLLLDDKKREDPILIEVVEELGNDASSNIGTLRVVEIPDELANNYMIDNYDGWETLHQRVEEY